MAVWPIHAHTGVRAFEANKWPGCARAGKAHARESSTHLGRNLPYMAGVHDRRPPRGRSLPRAAAHVRHPHRWRRRSAPLGGPRRGASRPPPLIPRAPSTWKPMPSRRTAAGEQDARAAAAPHAARLVRRRGQGSDQRQAAGGRAPWPRYGRHCPWTTLVASITNCIGVYDTCIDLHPSVAYARSK